MTPPSEKVSGSGLAYGLAAYLSWGFIALYFKEIKAVPPLLVLGHRVVWSVAFLAVLLVVSGQLKAIVRSLRHRRTLLVMFGSTLMIACNWFTFIWAVSNGHVLEASFGYFITPLVNVLLGVAVLRERLRRGQIIAIVLAIAGLIIMSAVTIYSGGNPLISLVLAASFGIYGLLRKIAPVGPLIGLSIETALLFPLALAYLIYSEETGNGQFAWGDRIGVLLMLGGVITAVPLLWFAAAARRLRLATVGFLQYVAPSCQLTLAVLYFGEPFTAGHAAGFGITWAAIAVFTADSVRAGWKGKRAKYEIRNTNDE